MDMSLSKLQALVRDREAGCAVVHGVARSQTRLRDCTELHWGDLPDPATEPWSLTLQADSLPSEPPVKPNEQSKEELKVWQGKTDYGGERSGGALQSTPKLTGTKN